MAVLSIQSRVTYGHVGNAIAVFALQRLGMAVWPVDTVSFSNHPGYGRHRGAPAEASSVAGLVAGLAELGVLPGCEAVLSGYLGTAAIGKAVLDAVARVRTANAASRYCCDPVIGDTAPGIYVAADIPGFLRQHALPAADILTPNQFELAWLSGQPAGTLAEARAAVQALLRVMRPGATILATGLRLTDGGADRVTLLTGGPDGFHRLQTPHVPIAASGAGDLLAAVFLFHLLRHAPAADAMAQAASAVFGVIAHTHEAGARELSIVAAQRELVSPSHRFAPHAC